MESMIGRLTGTLASAAPDGTVLIDVGGVGYVVRTPLFALAELTQSIGAVSLCIHTAVREDAIDLYGFPTDADLGFFKQLMSVSGIGPKTALAIMSVADTHSLRRAIAQGDSTTLVKVFGIGKKSAERLVVELRDKIKLDAPTHEAPHEEDSDVIEALIALGYSAPEARSTLKHIAPGASGTKERLAAALKHLGSK